MKKKLLGISYKNYINIREDMIPILEDIITITKNSEVEVFICPSMGVLETTAEKLENTKVEFGSQNIAPEKNGAFTGELSIESLKSLKGKYAEVGHYERMTIFNESEFMIKDKINLCFQNDIIPIICIGEREKLNYLDKKSFFKRTLLKYLDSSSFGKKIVVAYEPWWAIGRSKAADPDYVHESTNLIKEIIFEYRNLLDFKIIYGGSVSALNAEALLDDESIDGLFVGRFGHNVKDLNMILNIIEGAE